ncbi:MAG: glycosyltransferase family 4 protein [Bacteroidetes bacterium]|nr:glycosyltransferase family 4 protein [Bacteroidota bacterium]
MKRILLIASETNFSFENPNSAVANYLLTLKRSMEQNGYRVDTFPAIKEGGDRVVSTAQRSGISGKLKKTVKALFPRLYYGLVLRQKIKSLSAVSEFIISNYQKPDLIVEFLSIGSELSVRLKNHYKIPSVLIYDAPLLDQFCEVHACNPFFSQPVNTLEKKMVEHADALICYSASVQSYLQKQFQVKAAVSVLPCITWKEEIPENQNKEQVIGFIGSFLKWHRVDLLVKAFEKIAAEFTGARLVLLGYGQEWEKVKQGVDKSEFRSRIEMPGFVNEEQLTRYKHEFMIGVMPGSNWYGSPLKLFEYAQSSIAIIAPETPVVSDLFSTDEVLFIDKTNALESLTSNLRLLLRDDDLRIGQTRKSFAKMQGIYSRSEQLNKFNEIIAETLADGSYN